MVYIKYKFNISIMIDPYISRAITNLKKARGQIERIEKMIEDDKYCIDIAQQVNAALGLLKKTNNYILESHLLTCGTKKLAGSNKKSQLDFAKEIIRACNITNR